jgi:uncharacterized SAM-binding protein YcdF (DUF218 family)
MLLPYAPAFACLLVFVVGVLRERRRFSNAVFLGLSLLLAAGGWTYRLHQSHPVRDGRVGAALLVFALLGIVTLACFLVLNGLTMIRKEGVGAAGLLSLMTGVALASLAALSVTTAVLRGRTLTTLTATAVALTGYAGFLFVCFVVYAFVYGRLNLRRRADYVVVLGSGLVDGSEVPPLLASRLERARAVHGRLSRRGRQPVLLTSGGQGPDEKLPESHAMADYLVARGFPAALIRREDRSTSTEENLRFSRSIMEESKPDYRCVIVTNNYHAFRAALTARRVGVRGNVVGSPTAAYFWPSAMIREFVAICRTYWRTHLAVCLLVLAGGGALWRLG